MPFVNNLKNLDPSFKMDLDFWACFGRGKHPSYMWRNTVVADQILSLRSRPHLGRLLHLGKQQEVTEVVALSKNGIRHGGVPINSKIVFI